MTSFFVHFFVQFLKLLALERVCHERFAFISVPEVCTKRRNGQDAFPTGLRAMLNAELGTEKTMLNAELRTRNGRFIVGNVS